MSDDFENFYRGSRESRREFVTRRLADLRLDVDQTDPPEIAERKERERAARLAAHDALFADDFVEVAGAPRLISTDLAHKLGYRIERPAFTAGSDPDDGAVADDWRPE